MKTGFYAGVFNMSITLLKGHLFIVLKLFLVHMVSIDVEICS